MSKTAIIEADDVQTLSIAALKGELTHRLGLTVENLRRCAVIVGELERRGEDLSDMKIGILSLLRQIAKGTLLPEVVVNFADRPRVILQLSKRPVQEQKRAAEKGEFEQRPSHQRSPAAQSRRSDAIEGGWLGQLKQSVRGASSGDVAELCMELVSNADDPMAVAIRLEALLKTVKQNRAGKRYSA